MRLNSSPNPQLMDLPRGAYLLSPSGLSKTSLPAAAPACGLAAADGCGFGFDGRSPAAMSWAQGQRVAVTMRSIRGVRPTMLFPCAAGRRMQMKVSIYRQTCCNRCKPWWPATARCRVCGY